MEAVVPEEWAGREVRLRWDSGGEAMVWIQGEPQQVCSRKSCHAATILLEITLLPHIFKSQGLTGSHNGHQIRTDFILTKNAKPGEKYGIK